MNSSWMLIYLAAEWPEGLPSIPFEGWIEWKEGWEALGRNAKTLHQITTKLKSNVEKAKWGPAPLPIVGYDRWNNKYKSSPIANNLLLWFADLIEIGIPLIERHCQMHKDYLLELRKSPSIVRQWERTIGLLKTIKQLTGRCHFARTAALINVGRRITGVQKEETAESLRKLWKRHDRPVA